MNVFQLHGIARWRRDLLGACPPVNRLKAQTSDKFPDIKLQYLIENPLPFSIGDKSASVIPSHLYDRQFIPSAMMEDLFIYNFEHLLMKKLFESFPLARRLYLEPPPPVSSFEHIQKNPGIFRDKLHLGPSPAALRLELYRLQSKVIRRFAEGQGAVFINVKPELLDQEGFLLEYYSNNDPTHGNATYGKVMLKEIVENARAEQ